jgi:hypothetical protein
MENYYHLKAAAPYSLDSLLPLEIMDDLHAMNMAFVEKYGIHQLPERWKNSQGVYILFSHLQPGYRFEAYVGQTQKGFYSRLIKHEKERGFWDTAILARRTTETGFNSMQLNALEGKLRDILDESPNVHVHNQYPTGDKTLQPHDYKFIDEITLSIMRVMFMRGYRNQHMGAQADRLQASISGAPSTPAVAVPPSAPVAPTGFVGALGKLFGVSSPAPVPPVSSPAVAEHANVVPIAVTPAAPVAMVSETIDELGLTPAQRRKFEELRVWRKGQLAHEIPGTKAFHILPDATLKNICMASPKTPADLLQVAGIGQEKLNKYGEAILGVMVG